MELTTLRMSRKADDLAYYLSARKEEKDARHKLRNSYKKLSKVRDDYKQIHMRIKKRLGNWGVT